MLPTAEMSEKIAEWRRRCAPGADNPMTLEEYREAIKFMRAGRSAAPQATSGTKARKTAGKAAVDSQSLLDELENL